MLTSWLSFVVSSVSLSLSHWYPGSGVVLDCIISWSLQPYLLCMKHHLIRPKIPLKCEFGKCKQNIKLHNNNNNIYNNIWSKYPGIPLVKELTFRCNESLWLQQIIYIITYGRQLSGNIIRGWSNVYVYWACVTSRSSNAGLRFKEDLIFLTKFSMAAKFIEKFIFLQGIHVQNLKVSFIYLTINIICL